MPSRLIYPFPSPEIAPVAEVGGKGSSLLIGSTEGLPVPPGFILSVHFFAPSLRQVKATSGWSDFLRSSGNDQMKACDALKKAADELFLDDAQEEALSRALEPFGEDTLFAVRSSSPEEDLESSSFAGGYETVLGVTKSMLHRALAKAFASCLDYRVVVYKRENGFAIDDPKIAVIVQQQIASDVAGVGFSLNPVTNNYDEAVVNANWGLGETVVSGTATTDTYLVDKIRLKVKSKTLGKKETSIWLLPNGGTEEKPNARHDSFALPDTQILELARLIGHVERLYEMPIDIEWAYAKGQLFLLQARPITAYVPLPPAMVTQPGKRRRLYLDITISVQGMYEPISVASVSFFRLFHKRVGNMLFWRDLSRNDIDSAIPWADAGRLYVNLSNVLRLASQKKIADFMVSFDQLAAKTIQGADGREYLSRTNRLKLLPFGALRKIPAVLLHVRRAKESPEQEHLRSQAKLRRFMDDAVRLAQKETSFVLLSEKLIDRLIEDVCLNTVPLFIIGRIALRKLKKTAGEEFEEYFPKLELSLPNNITTEMGMAISRMVKLLPSGLNAEEIHDGIDHSTLPQPFLSAWRQFVDGYGCRGPLEVDVAAPRYRENSPLVASMLVAARGSSDKEDPVEKFTRNQEVRKNAYDAIYQGIRRRNADEARRFAAQYAIFQTFSGYRESHKFYAAFVTDLVRQKILQGARELLAAGRLQSLEQAFDLTLDQLDRAPRDPSLDLLKQAKENRAFAGRLARVPQLPTVVDSRGLILRAPRPPTREGAVAGTPVSSGVARGRIKILHSPGEKPLLKGEILVARGTDPGWTPLFVNAAGVILEVGGLLQHGALVAREYGLPCVAGVEHAIELWNDGDMVEVDGSAGIVRKIP